MRSNDNILIVGGGLAGLSLSILLAREGLDVSLWEKSDYPKHKVCGEYISVESLPFLERIGLGASLKEWPRINRFKLTAAPGLSGECTLHGGGIGVSRYHLDHLLYQTAIANGVKLQQNSAVKNIDWDAKNKIYLVKSSTGTASNHDLVIGAFGRINGLVPGNGQRKKYIGVKYHISDGPPLNTIEMHHFKGGYCGVSAVESNKFCLCYLADAQKFKPFKGDFELFEETVLSENPFLKERLQAPKLFEGVRTAHIAFGVTDLEDVSYPLTGDALGFIPPITGNGMSLAFRSAAYLYPKVLDCVSGKINRADLLRQQQQYARKYLRKRIKRGIFLQNLIAGEKAVLHQTIMSSLTQFPFLMRLSAKMAVGRAF